MAFGLRIKDAAGAIQVQYTDSLPRIVAEFYTGTSDGAVNIPELSGAASSTYFVLGGNQIASFLNMPEITISGTVVSWAFVSATERVSVLVAVWRIG